MNAWNKKSFLWSLSALAVFGFAAGWAYPRLDARLALTRAEAQVKKGYLTLAIETLEPVRALLVSSPRSCDLLVNSYFTARRTDRLEWAAQACMDAGVETSTVEVGIAEAQEFAGHDGEALQGLTQVTQKYPGSPDAYYRMAQIYHRIKDETRAADATLKAAERSSNNAIILEAMQLLSAQKQWVAARKMAMMLRSAPTEDPEVKLVIARAMSKAGDSEGARVAVQEARGLLEKKPELAEGLSSRYADVLETHASRSVAKADH